MWLSVVLAVSLTLAGLAVIAATAQAGSYSDGFPKQVLMKGGAKLPDGDFNYGGWHWYEAGEWQEIYGDYGEWPDAVPVRAGAKLHIKINKPERPASFRIRAYNKGKMGGQSGKSDNSIPPSGA